jgi:hypothetical protein
MGSKTRSKRGATPFDVAQLLIKMGIPCELFFVGNGLVHTGNCRISPELPKQCLPKLKLTMKAPGSH